MKHGKTWIGRVFIGISLDGYIARLDGDIAWLNDPPLREHARIESSRQAESWDTFFPAVDHVMMGRGTYEKVVSFEEWPYTGKKVVVLSTTLPSTDKRVTVVRTLGEVCQELALGNAKQVYVDGGKVVQTFFRHGLIDELTVCHAPVLVGSGIPLFSALAHDVHLTLRASHATDGMVHSTYTVEHLDQKRSVSSS